MHIASRNGHCKVVRNLLEAKAHANIKTNVSHIDGVVLYSILYQYISKKLCTFVGKVCDRFSKVCEELTRFVTLKGFKPYLIDY